MKRTTQPDMYSQQVKDLLNDWRTRRIPPEAFAIAIAAIWDLRNGTRY